MRRVTKWSVHALLHRDRHEAGGRVSDSPRISDSEPRRIMGQAAPPSMSDHSAEKRRGEISSAILDSLLESSRSSPIFSVDRAYRYTSFNASHIQVMKALYGADIEIGKSILECQTVEDDRLTAQANLDRALCGERLVADAFSGEEARATLLQGDARPHQRQREHHRRAGAGS
jgi:hypothetical protein